MSFYPLTLSPSYSDVRVFQGFLSQETSLSFGSHPPEAAYHSTLPRCSSAPDLFPQARITTCGYHTQDSMTDSTGVRRRCHLPAFDSSHSFQTVPSTYEGQQDSSSLPGVQPAFDRYLEVGTSVYNSPNRVPGFLEPPHSFIETVPTVDPHVLHHVSDHRHGSWGDTGVESNYNGIWTSTVRDQSYRHQMPSYESGTQGYREHYQYSTVSNSQFTESAFMLIFHSE